VAALVSSDGGQDPVDGAIRAPAVKETASDLPKLTKFVPFDLATKMSEATATDPGGDTVRAVKGAFAAVAGLMQPDPDAAKTANELEANGFRTSRRHHEEARRSRDRQPDMVCRPAGSDSGLTRAPVNDLCAFSSARAISLSACIYNALC